MRCYIALLHKDGGRGYRVELPDFPGCAAWTDLLDDTPRLARRILAEEADLRRRAGQPMPRSSALEAVADGAAARAGVPIVVPAPSPPPQDRVSVSVDLPAGLVERVDRRARIRGVDRSDILEKATRLALWETGRIERAVADVRTGK